ncbi:MAG: radical SAM protein [Acidobacteria bacterium]|nr:radical SAM protein [Acidobacteriota bacterium]
MRSGFLPDRIVHLHPTRLCNLACRHCYSESSPQRAAALDPVVVGDALARLRDEGYAVVSLSGGEPLLYRSLRAVVERAKELGFRVTMVSNGLLAERADSVLSLVDAVAISFDGLAGSHNEIRGRADAFERACAAVRRLAAVGRPVGAAISLTRAAIPELPDLADHLTGLGARALQIRPVARAGRARELGEATFYRPADLARLYLVSLALEQELPNVRVHCDVVPTETLWQHREAYASLLGACDGLPIHERRLSDLVNPLVVTDTGVLKPISYDFNRRFDIASLEELSSDGVRRYKKHGALEFQTLVGRTVASLQNRGDFIDWFDYCTRYSEAVGAPVSLVRA